MGQPQPYTASGSLLVNTLKQMDYQASSNAIGRGGTATFKFVARGVGTVTLQLKYWRSFEGDQSVTQGYAGFLRRCSGRVGAAGEDDKAHCARLSVSTCSVS